MDVLRVLLGGGDALAGAALGLAGAITQSIARNPPASPDILGITSGAGAAAVAVIVLGGASGPLASTFGSVGLPVAALCGGLATALLIYVLAYRRGIDGYRLVLVGVGVNAALVSVISYLLIHAKITDAARATVWLTGSLNGHGWEHVRPVALALVVLVPIALVLVFVLGALQFGDDTARGLGVRVNLARSALLLVAVGLAAVATS